MAVFNNGYGMNYGQNYGAPNYGLSAQPAQTSSGGGIIWVQGEGGAKAFPVGPGASVVLFDSERDIFYIKSTDQSGMPQPLRIFPYKETTEEELRNSNTPNTDKFITREEFERVINSLKSERTYQKKGGQNNVKPAISREPAE